MIGFLYFQLKTENKNSDPNEFILDSSKENATQLEIIPRYPIPDLE